MATDDSHIAMLQTESQERKKYVRIRIIVACALLITLTIIIVVTNLDSTDSTATDSWAILAEQITFSSFYGRSKE